MQIRLQKWLSDTGVASRRASEELIKAGRVAVNGRTAMLGEKADTERDDVTLDGRTVRYGTEFVYICLHKPEGVVTTASDPEGRATVMDLLQGIDARVYPVGRLDYDSSGLLLMTNDGEWANRVVHPRYGVKKKYAAWITGTPTNEELARFSQGVIIDGYKTSRSEIKIISRKFSDFVGTVERSRADNAAEDRCLVHIVLSEGRNRQIRKMCEAIGHPVVSLKRIAVGPVKLGQLKRGEWRHLTEEEVNGFH
jgi:pseudouridine synthase